MKVLVTGGAGFIGSHVADRLLKLGHTVHVLDSLTSGHRENLAPEATFHHLDIRDPGVEDLFQAEGFEALVHHAAQMDVRRSVADPLYDADVNIQGLLNLMESGRKNGLRRVVFASTGGAIYGEPESVPQDEEHPLRPMSPYGITKLSSEKYLDFYRQVYGIEAMVLRYANVFGPRQDPHGEAGVVAIFSQAFLGGRQPVIYGDGLQTRDYVFVGDVVRAVEAGLELDRSALVNIGTGIETSVVQLFELIRRFVGADCPKSFAEGRAGEQRRSVLSYRKAERLLGWAPKVTLEEGLRQTVEWFRGRSS